MKISPPKIMLVDDEPHVIAFLSEILHQISFEVIGTASSGDEALLKLCDIDPDMVILDITMPGISGEKAVAKIKAKSPGTLVVMLTSRNTIDMVKVCRDGGADGYLLKSESGENICQRIQEIWFQQFIHSAKSSDSPENHPADPSR